LPVADETELRRKESAAVRTTALASKGIGTGSGSWLGLVIRRRVRLAADEPVFHQEPDHVVRGEAAE
jgi:hypothetical protein